MNPVDLGGPGADAAPADAARGGAPVGPGSGTGAAGVQRHLSGDELAGRAGWMRWLLEKDRGFEDVGELQASYII